MTSAREVYNAYPDVLFMHAISQSGPNSKVDFLPLKDKLNYSLQRLKCQNTPIFSMWFRKDTFTTKKFADVGIIVRDATIVRCYKEDGGIINYDDPSSWPSGDEIVEVIKSEVQNEIVATCGQPGGIYLNMLGLGDWTHMDVRVANSQNSLHVYGICDLGMYLFDWSIQKNQYVRQSDRILKIKDIL